MKLKKNAQPVREGRGKLLCRGCFWKEKVILWLFPFGDNLKNLQLGKSGKIWEKSVENTKKTCNRGHGHLWAFFMPLCVCEWFHLQFSSHYGMRLTWISQKSMTGCDCVRWWLVYVCGSVLVCSVFSKNKEKIVGRHDMRAFFGVQNRSRKKELFFLKNHIAVALVFPLT